MQLFMRTVTEKHFRRRRERPKKRTEGHTMIRDVIRVGERDKVSFLQARRAMEVLRVGQEGNS